MAIAVTNLPATTRSVLLLVTPTATSAGNTVYQVPIINGDTSGQLWRPFGASGAWLAVNGAANPVAGVAQAVQYFPMYGLVDTSFHMTWVVTNGSNVDQAQYWVIALPDSDINGSTFIPITVANPFGYGGSSPIPLLVQNEPVTGRTGTGVSGRQLTTTTFQQLVGPPAAGLIRVIDFIQSTATGTPSWGVNANVVEMNTPAGTNSFNPGWLLAAGGVGLWAGSSVTGGAFYVSWHDENV